MHASYSDSYSLLSILSVASFSAALTLTQKPQVRGQYSWIKPSTFACKLAVQHPSCSLFKCETPLVGCFTSSCGLLTSGEHDSLNSMAYVLPYTMNFDYHPSKYAVPVTGTPLPHLCRYSGPIIASKAPPLLARCVNTPQLPSCRIGPHQTTALDLIPEFCRNGSRDPSRRQSMV